MSDTRRQILDMAINGSGVRDTGCVLQVAKGIAISTIAKQESILVQVNSNIHQLLREGADIAANVGPACDNAELDEQWSFVGKKSKQRWLWYAIDHDTGALLAYIFGRRKDKVFHTLKELLKPFGIRRFYSDDWGAYKRNLNENEHEIAKKHPED